MGRGSIVIPQKFKIKNYTIQLKDRLEGVIIYDENIKSSYFQSDSHNIKIILGADDWKGKKHKDDVKLKILEIYLKGIEEVRSLSKYEIPVFYYIQDGFESITHKNKILFIGYKNNYLNTIKNTLSRFGVKCDVIELDKNIETYSEDEYKKVMTSIGRKISSNVYDKIVIDIPNVYLNSDYLYTKTLLEKLHQTDKKLLVLVQEPTDRFFNIFGERYKDIMINRKYPIRCGTDRITTDTIERVLF